MEQAFAITVTDETEDDMIKTIDLTLLNGTSGFTLDGVDRRDASGYSVSSAGDVNGDGYDDLIIGAYGAADPNGVDSGKAYVVYGGASAPGTDGVLALSALDGRNGFTLTGIDSFDYSSVSVSSAGDVNGDGYDDLIIGATGADQNEALNAGETYVVYGGASAPGTKGVLPLSALDGTNGFTLTGIDPDDVSGASVSSAGDVNGDGYDDLIIGARRADPNGSRSGETYVVYGGSSAPGTDGVLDLSALDGTSGFTLNGIDPGDVSGYSVSSAGDVNGDGYDDLIIGARGADPNGARSGETYVVYGGTSAPGANGVLNLSALDGANGFTLTGTDPDDRSGRSVSSAGDVNGDGYDDLIIGAHRADPNGASSGEVYVVYGGASAPGTDGVLALSALDGTNGFTLTGIDPDDESGRSVSSAGDVNGDGYDDLIIGARFADPDGKSDAGETYVVYGSASAPGTDGVLALSALDGTNGFSLTGIGMGDRSGVSVSSAGDVNGDGYDDLIIGAPGAEPNGARSGETYVVYGGATGTESVVPVTAQGTASADNFTGNAGADTFTGIAAGDVVRGGAGDDSISATSLDFAHIDGGTGSDTLVLAGSGLSLDLTGAGNAGVDSVEVLDLSGTGADTLVLDALAVFDVTEERDGGMASLDVRGAAEDSADLRGFRSDSTETEDGTTYNVYRDGNAQVRVQDGVVVKLTPVFTSPDHASVPENLDAGSVVYTAVARDPEGDALTYSLSGTDAALFTIEAGTTAGTAEVRFRAAPDFENPVDDDKDNVHDIIVTAADGHSNSTDHAVAITVTNLNDNAPVFTSPKSASVGENLGVGSAAYTAVAHDADGDVLTYSLDGTDAEEFTIDSNTGAVRFKAAPDFENPLDVGGDNVYDITVTASDGDGADSNSTDHTVAITVADENEPPVFTSLNSASVPENLSVQSVVYTAVASDPEGDTLIYSLSGTDAALFTIDPVTGAVRFKAAPDFENPLDDGKDNVYDIIVTATDGDGTDRKSTDHAVAITVTNINDNDSLSMLDGTNGFTLTGIGPGDRSGFSVSSAGDVNGDGYDDLIVGARFADPGGESDAGETYVVYGGANAPGTDGVLALSVLDGTNGFTLTGIDPGDRSGVSVSSAGDVNGDGYGDLIIGADGADSDAGETHVVYGGASALGTETDDGRKVFDLSALNGTNGFTLTGIEQFDVSGFSVSSAGDVNGDGYDDLIIGADGANRVDLNEEGSGETYVVYGGARAPGTATDDDDDDDDDDGREVFDLSALDGSNGFTLSGIDLDDESGRSVSSAGDVNGDGYDDLIIGAYGADPNGKNWAGETYVVYGGASAPGTDGVLGLSALDGTNGFTLNGIDPGDRSGYSVSSAGDVNGDGYDDLIIGAPGANPGKSSGSRGETYVVYGGASAPGTGMETDDDDDDGREVFDLSALDGTNGFTLNGIDPGDESGRSVSSAGDVNGDGYDDLIIGAYGADPNGERGAGETYVVYGGASAPGTDGVLALSALDGTNGFTLTGIDAEDQSGRSVSSAGDVNGDGYDDLIIGARSADPNGLDSGETYVVYGGATGTESIVPVTTQGTVSAENFTGNAGADTFTDIAAGDVVRGGAGDDRISVTSLDFAHLDGGTGRDTLVLDGSGLSLDLTGAGTADVDSVEVLDLSGTGADTLVLDALAVFDLTEERDGGMASLDVLGDADDTVDLSGANFVADSSTETEAGTTYSVYRDGNAEVRVQDGVSVTLVASGLQRDLDTIQQDMEMFASLDTDMDGS